MKWEWVGGLEGVELGWAVVEYYPTVITFYMGRHVIPDQGGRGSVPQHPTPERLVPGSVRRCTKMSRLASRRF